jgi:hypothetical protein
VFYVPVIKSKRGEFTAVRMLRDDVKSSIRPFLDILPPSRFAPKPKTLAEHLSSVAEHAATAWSGALWVDTFEVGPMVAHGKQVAIEFVCRDMQTRALTPIPVTGFGREATHDLAVKRLLSESASGACLRLEVEDLLLPARLPTLLDLKLKFLGLDAPNIDLLLDLRYLDATPTATRVHVLVRALQGIPSVEAWRSIIFAGSSMPNSLEGVCARGSHGYLVRREQEIWQALQQSTVKRLPTFGDYTTVPPLYADMDTRTIAKHLGPNVKYTLDKRWYVSRGQSFQKSGSGQYFGIAKNIVSLPDFRGPAASEGDLYIAQRGTANSSAKCGNPEQWITASVNSHISWQTRSLTPS